jgi:hypothetical protein
MPADQPLIPSTAARLATSITLRLLPTDINPSTVTVAQISQAQVLGAVMEFSEKNDRPVQTRYELDADEVGNIVEQLPQLVSRTLMLQRAVLYASDMLEAFGIAGGDLINQSQPFAIIKEEFAPQGAVDSTGNAIPTRITIFSGCWFTSNPKSFKVSSAGDIRVLQEVEVAYAQRFIVSA